MANFISLNAGLNQAGDTARHVGSFLQNERQLELDQQRANDYSAQVDMQRKEQQEKFRLQQNTEFARSVLQTTTEASRARKPDGSTFKTYGEYLDSEQGKQSRDLIANGLAKSNSRYRTLIGDRKIRTTRGADGKMTVEAQKGNEWEEVKDPDGNKIQFTGDDLAQQARFDMASAGVAEIVYFKRDAQRKMASGEITEEEYNAVMQDLQTRGASLQDGVSKAGIDFNAVVDSAVRGDPSHPDMPAEAFAQVMAPEAPATATGPQQSVANAANNIRTELGSVFMEDSTIAKGARGVASMLLLGMDVGPQRGASTGGGASGVIPATEAQATIDAVIPKAEQRGIIPPPATEPPPGQKNMHVNRANVVLERIAQPDTRVSAEQAHDAAVSYANAMVINGWQPNPQILANLYAGDDMAGSMQHGAALRAKYDIQYMKNHAAAQKVNAGNADLSLKLRKQVIAEREKAAEAAAEASFAPGVKDRGEAVKQMKSLIDNGFSVYASQLGHLGYIPSELPSSLATLPQFAQIFAKYYKEDLNTTRHNLGETDNWHDWFPNLKEHKTLMDKVMKEVYVMDPKAFANKVYSSVVAAYPDRQANDPRNIEQVRQVMQHYAKQKTPQEVYQDAE